MMVSAIRSATLVAVFSLLALAASAQTFGEFLSQPELPLTFMGVDFSNARYYGPPLTVDSVEMKDLFYRINDLLEKEAEKYDLTTALRRTKPATYALFIAESANQYIDPGTIIVRSGATPRAKFTVPTVEGLISHYKYPAALANSGIGVVFVVEDISKIREQEIFWVTFVDLATKQMLYTEKMAGVGEGFGFRNHWAHPFYNGIGNIRYRYREWKKRFGAKS